MMSDSTLGKRKDKESERARKRISDSDNADLTFYYSREERLKRLKGYTDRKRPLFFVRKRVRGILILLIDLLLIASVLFFINKPKNLYMKKTADGLLYELNIAGVRGRKTLVGLTIRNQKPEAVVLAAQEPVWIRIYAKEGEAVEFVKSLEKDILLEPGESSSVIFLIDEENLPRTGRLELFYSSSSSLLFSKIVRF